MLNLRCNYHATDVLVQLDMLSVCCWKQHEGSCDSEVREGSIIVAREDCHEAIGWTSSDYIDPGLADVLGDIVCAATEGFEASGTKRRNPLRSEAQ